MASIYFFASGQHPVWMKETYPSRVADKIVIRAPNGMRDRLADAAKANNRSTNAEIVARLEASFGADVENLPARIETLERQVSRFLEDFAKVTGKRPPKRGTN